MFPYRQFTVAGILIVLCALPAFFALYFIQRQTKKMQGIYEVQLIRIVQLETSCNVRRANSVSLIYNVY